MPSSVWNLSPRSTPFDERGDRLGLVAGGREIGDELEIGHASDGTDEPRQEWSGFARRFLTVLADFSTTSAAALAASSCQIASTWRFEVREVACVVDHPRRDRAALLVGGLQRNPALGVVARDAARFEAVEAQLARCLDDDHRVVLEAALRLDEQRHVVDDDPVGGRGRDLARGTPRRSPGCVIASRSFFASRRSTNALGERGPVERCRRPAGSRARTARPACASAGVPGSTTCRAIESASTTTAPRAVSSAATVDLPAPIPPVSPTINMRPRSLPTPTVGGERCSHASGAPRPTERRARSRRAGRAAADGASGVRASSQERVGSKRGCLTRLVACAALPHRPRRGS